MRDGWFGDDPGVLECFVAEVTVRFVAFYYGIYWTRCNTYEVVCDICRGDRCTYYDDSLFVC